ncbi:MAG: NlpC/P60 family protein [Myxococcota bacterium]
MPSPSPRAPSWRTLLVGWLGCALVLGVALSVPVVNNVVRFSVVGATAALWLMALRYAWRGRVLRVVVVLPLLGVAGVAVAPGGERNVEELRAHYLTALPTYDGVPYVWGGESPDGIDCSGLVRRALRDALIEHALRHRDAQSARDAFLLWWVDDAAVDLRDHRNRRTVLVREARSLRTLDPHEVQPGDLAVTASGIHVLAYLGEGQWIEASPQRMKVGTFHAHDDNPWSTVRIHLVRWRYLATTM